MSQLQISTSQFLSSVFLRQLASINTLRFTMASPESLCTNLSAGALGGLDCVIGDIAKADDVEADKQLIIFAENLNLEKLWQIQQGIAAHALAAEYESIMHPAEDGRFAMALHVLVQQPEGIKATIETLCQQYKVDIVLVSQQRPSIKQPGLLVMDMDSTVIAAECIDEIALLAGVGEQVAAVTEQAMQGKLDFAESLKSRVACLAGADESILQQVQQSLPMMPGIESLVRVLQQHGWKLAIASGGFTYFANYLQQRLQLDRAVSNTLVLEQGKLTGEVSGEIIDAAVKARTLNELANEFAIAPQQTIAMGDGANDLKMMDAAQLGVACHAKPLVREKADVAIRFAGLDALLYLIS